MVLNRSESLLTLWQHHSLSILRRNTKTGLSRNNRQCYGEIAWTAYYFLSLFKYFVKYFFPLNREDLLNLMELAKDSPDAKQELLDRLLTGKRMTGRDEMDIKRILKTKEALNNIRKFLDKKGNK